MNTHFNVQVYIESLHALVVFTFNKYFHNDNNFNHAHILVVDYRLLKPCKVQLVHCEI